MKQTRNYKIWIIRAVAWLFFAFCLCVLLLPEHYFFNPTGEGNDEKLIWYLTIFFIVLMVIYILRRRLERSLEVELYYGVCLVLSAVLLGVILFMNLFFSDFSPHFG